MQLKKQTLICKLRIVFLQPNLHIIHRTTWNRTSVRTQKGVGQEPISYDNWCATLYSHTLLDSMLLPLEVEAEMSCLSQLHRTRPHRKDGVGQMQPLPQFRVHARHTSAPALRLAEQTEIIFFSSPRQLSRWSRHTFLKLSSWKETFVHS